ncbi:Os01g0719350 [Oryza sativa Japonica Group]|uniref:Os01g0719350 protein n=1 Tax=Oryza sativa subsp. japonica TaxID=39947 RepID=A0A0P0V7H6_ORYSJ|nr:Os01g0719350 [Oryza sativa Japonica Group]
MGEPSCKTRMPGMLFAWGYCFTSRKVSLPAMFPSLQVAGLATYSNALTTDKPTCKNAQPRGAHQHHDAEEGDHADAEVELVDLVEVAELLDLDEPDHGDDDDGGERHQRGVLEEGCQEQQHQHDAHRHHHVRHRRLAPGVEVAEAKIYTCREVAGGERTGDVHDTKRDHLLVAVDLLVLDHRQASADGYSFLEKHRWPPIRNSGELEKTEKKILMFL